MMVTSTHPGTSPRSCGPSLMTREPSQQSARDKGDRQPTDPDREPAALLQCMEFGHRAPPRFETTDRRSREDREEHGDREHEEDDRDHHRYLLACRRPRAAPDDPTSRTSSAWARSTSASGVPRSTATTTPSTKRARLGRAGPLAELVRAPPGARHPARASASHRPGSFVELASRCHRHTRSRASDGALARTPRRARAARRSWGNSARIRSSRIAPARLSRRREPPRLRQRRATQSATAGRARIDPSGPEQHRAARGPPRPRSHPTPPARLGRRRGRARDQPVRGDAATDVPPPRPVRPPHRVRQHGPEQPLDHGDRWSVGHARAARPESASTDSHQQRRGGKHPAGTAARRSSAWPAWPTVRGAGRPIRSEAADQPPRRPRGTVPTRHRSTRCSSGSRPMRSMIR